MSAEELATSQQGNPNLRQELKDWEKAFAATNEGRKPGRDDIKKDPAIALKYKEYSRLKPIPANIAAGNAESKARPIVEKEISKSKRKRHDVESTPSKRPQSSSSIYTPSKEESWNMKEGYDSPSAVRNLLTTPKIFRTSIGPTPQRDGKALGLFDLLTPSPAHAVSRTLPKNNSAIRSSDKKNLLDDTQRTPKRKSTADAITSTPSRTLQLPQTSKTPSSTNSSQFRTPAFLRRDSQRFRPDPEPSSLEQINEDAADADAVSNSPVFVRMPAKPPVRGLSALLAGLRKMQDDDVDAQEAAAAEAFAPQTPSKKAVVMDFQPSLPGHDVGVEDEAEAAMAGKADAHQPQRRSWKKKGQKRTTRRVTIRPNRSGLSKSRAVSSPAADHDNDDSEDQAEGKEKGHEDMQPDEFEDVSDLSDASSVSEKKKKPAKAATGQKRRKINPNAAAHGNFRSLKIRNKKGAGGARRFGRGR